MSRRILIQNFAPRNFLPSRSGKRGELARTSRSLLAGALGPDFVEDDLGAAILLGLGSRAALRKAFSADP